MVYIIVVDPKNMLYCTTTAVVPVSTVVVRDNAAGC